MELRHPRYSIAAAEYGSRTLQHSQIVPELTQALG